MRPVLFRSCGRSQSLSLRRLMPWSSRPCSSDCSLHRRCGGGSRRIPRTSARAPPAADHRACARRTNTSCYWQTSDPPPISALYCGCRRNSKKSISATDRASLVIPHQTATVELEHLLLPCQIVLPVMTRDTRVAQGTPLLALRTKFIGPKSRKFVATPSACRALIAHELAFAFPSPQSLRRDTQEPGGFMNAGHHA